MKVSIVTPSYQQGEFIERTIQSVLRQVCPFELEYVVMDGGSKDQTMSVLERYQDKLRFRSEPDRGQAHAVNKGIAATSGDIIGWLNSDDIYYPDAIQKVCQYFADNPTVDVVYGEANFIDREDKVLKLYPTEKWNLSHFKSRCFISQPATFFRRRAVVQYGALDETLHFCLDYEYWLRLALAGAKIAYIPAVLAATRVYPETKTSSGFLKANEEAIKMLQSSLQEDLPPEWVVSAGGAEVRSRYGFNFPDLRYIFLVWWHLWHTTGQFKAGLPRLTLWLKAQFAMLAKFFRRTTN